MRRRKVWLALSLLLAVVFLGAAWAGWTAYRVNQDLSASVDDVNALRTAIEDGDDAAADAQLERLQAHSASATDRTGGLTWSVLEHAPVFGDDATGVSVVSSVVHDLTASGIRPLVQVSHDLDSIVPADGKIDIAVVEQLQLPTSEASAAFADADDRLSDEDPSGYVERLRTKYRDLAGQVHEAATSLAHAETAVQVLPSMLGAESAQNYLLVFQNNAEVRATGGLPGAVSLVHADDGAVSMTRQVAASSFPYAKTSPLPLTPAEKKIYDPVMGAFFLNANLQPDFGRASDLWAARWEQVYPDRIDGVLSIDPVAISYLLGATGQLEVDGVTLTEDNAVDELLHQAYLRYPDPKDQDAFFRDVARAMFDRVAGGAESPRDLLSALARGATEHRIYVHDFHDETQSSLAGTGVAGELVTTATTVPQVGVYLDDGTGAKMSYFLRYTTDIDATYCTNGVQALTGHMSMLSDAPDNAASLPDYVTGAGIYGVKPGEQVVFVRIYGPVGGTVTDVEFNGKPLTGFPPVDDNGRKVFTVVAQLRPQQKVDVTWRMKTGPGQSGDTRVSVTPSVVPGNSSSTIESAC